MGEIDEALERVERTRPIPVHLGARVRFLWEKVAKKDTRALAQVVGVSVRSAQRWVKALAAGVVPTMTKENERKVEQAVRRHWQPGVRRRVRRAAEQRGFLLHIQAQFGYQSAAGSTDDPRMRTITQHLPGEVAQRLFTAVDAGATQRSQERILADALQEHYFRDNGRRATGLLTDITGLQWADFDIT
ncbi:telomere-protecting terminal protein Tpg [Kitasatospora sp. LaBMicrA B282]|uniref:telomere-protecting terminal protein Tpg n=1 Tax=Kitasatospora sp. LaBMicrA B282 TaxID=3420949 RepID=UPI003D0C64C4